MIFQSNSIILHQWSSVMAALFFQFYVYMNVNNSNYFSCTIITVYYSSWLIIYGFSVFICYIIVQLDFMIFFLNLTERLIESYNPLIYSSNVHNDCNWNSIQVLDTDSKNTAVASLLPLLPVRTGVTIWKQALNPSPLNWHL